MRLIGKTRDYYDGALSLGRDDDLLFHRESKAGDVSIAHYIADRVCDVLGAGADLRKRNFMFDPSCEFIRIRVIGFCGKLYGYAQLDMLNHCAGPEMRKLRRPLRLPFHGECFYGQDGLGELETILLLDGMEYVRRMFHQKQPWPPRRSDRIQVQKILKVIDTLPAVDDLFINAHTPYLLVTFDPWRECEVTLTPVLADSQFCKVKDPFSAFQEISMYLGGVIPRQAPELVLISDKDRIAQHGFDKDSFRHPFK